MKLTGPQAQQIHEAILSGFNKSDLKKLVRFRLNKSLDSIARDSSLTDVVFELIERAEQRGWTEELIRAVMEYGPNKKEIQELARLLSSPDGPSKPQGPPPVTPGNADSTEPGPNTTHDPSAGSEATDDREKERWETYRFGIQEQVEGLLEELSREETQGSRILSHIAKTLGVRDLPRDPVRARKTIAENLCDSNNEYSVPRLMRIHGDFSKANQDRPAEVIADCINLIFPIYLSPGAFVSALRQAEHPEFVLILGTVATEIGADAVLSGLDGGSPSYVLDKSGPRCEYLVPFEWPAPDDPSHEREVLAVLEHLVVQAKIGFTNDMAQYRKDDVPVRKKLLSEALAGEFSMDEYGKGRARFCVFAALRRSSDFDRKKRVLKSVRVLVPHLWFVELDPEAPTVRREFSMKKWLKTRNEWEEKRKRK